MLPGMGLLLRIANGRCLPSVLFGAQGQWNPPSCSSRWCGPYFRKQTGGFKSGGQDQLFFYHARRQSVFKKMVSNPSMDCVEWAKKVSQLKNGSRACPRDARITEWPQVAKIIWKACKNVGKCLSKMLMSQTQKQRGQKYNLWFLVRNFWLILWIHTLHLIFFLDEFKPWDVLNNKKQLIFFVNTNTLNFQQLVL